MRSAIADFLETLVLLELLYGFQAIAFWGEEEDFWSAETILKTYREYGLDDKFIISKYV